MKFVADFFPPAADHGAGGRVTLQCGTKRVPTSVEGFRTITPTDLRSMMEEGRPLFLLDVREPFELVAFGAIPGVKNVSIREVAQRRGELPDDRSGTIVVVCQSGNRSSEVAHYLAKEGYSNVYNLAGGTSAWIQNGNAVTQTLQPMPMRR